MDTKATPSKFTVLKTYNDKQCYDSIIRMVYGFYVKDLNDALLKSVKSPFNIYMFYDANIDTPDCKKILIGIEYDRILNLFDELHFSHGKHLQLSKKKISPEMITLFKKNYPDKIANTYAVFSDRDDEITGKFRERSSWRHQEGRIMYGYWVSVENTTKINYDVITECMWGIDGITFSIWVPGHNLQHRHQMFCGIVLADINYDETDAQKWSSFVSKKYEVDKTHVLPSESEIRKVIVEDSLAIDWDYEMNGYKHPGKLDSDLITITKKPMIAFIPRNCYCCT